MDHVPSMLAYWDQDLRCRFANRAYERWLGFDARSMPGRNLREVLGERLFALNESYIRAALRGEPQRFERLIPGPDGVERHGLADYIPDVRDGVVRGFLVQVIEITNLKLTQAALAREHALRKQVERDARELDRLLRERSEMLDVLAHEVRQPLNNASAVLQRAGSALDKVGDAAATLQVRRAQAVMGQVLASIDNTLAATSLLARPNSISRLDTDIDLLVAVAVADMPAEGRERVRVERATSTRTASMDVGLMRLALRNLLSNALKYSPRETPVVVHLSDSDEPLALVIDVIDSGSGIPAELVPKVFDRGERARTAKGTPGHGLGLYIVRRVMELHGGSVELARNGPQGTTMRLVIQQH
ncbi:MAG: PAS domain-containing protein [Burkholderiales bacterium]|nr:PAS domain-containing protein [Burkholderiales bacterium]